MKGLVPVESRVDVKVLVLIYNIRAGCGASNRTDCGRLVTTLGLIGIELLVVIFGQIVFIAISCVELVQSSLCIDI